MFKFLKEKIKNTVSRLSRKIEEEAKPESDEKPTAEELVKEAKKEIELEKRGLTPENLEQIAADMWKWYGRIELCFFVSGTVRKLSTEGIERFLRNYADDFITARGGKLTKSEQKLLLRRLSKLTPAELRKIGHHLFPNALKKEFARAGININKKEFLEYIGKEFHKVLHSKGTIRPNDWVEWWKRFFKPFGKKIPGKSQILKALGKCLSDFEFANVEQIMRRISGILLH